jgi:AcrR family transcriptional regulator
MSRTKLEGSARDRLLAAANELFYEEGVHTVGIDRVIERAGVAKASLYSTFGSKEELVLAYLGSRSAARQRRVSERIARHESARDKIVAIFELMGEIVAEPQFRGCAFANASAEGPRDAKVSGVCTDHRAWLRRLLIELAREAGALDPELLGRQLQLLYDGAIVAAATDRDAGGARVALAAVQALLALNLPTTGKNSRPKRASKAAERRV